MANTNPIRKSKELSWTDKEEKLLKKLYPNAHNQVCANRLGKSVRAIRSKAQAMKLKKTNRYWDMPDEAFLIANWPVMTADELGEKLNRTRWAVINKYREITGKRK